MKKTNWYPSSVKPVREGIYEVGHSYSLHWNHKKFLIGSARYFDGENWMAGWNDDVISIFGSHESHQWRGLAINPKDKS